MYPSTPGLDRNLENLETKSRNLELLGMLFKLIRIPRHIILLKWASVFRDYSCHDMRGFTNIYECDVCWRNIHIKATWPKALHCVRWFPTVHTNVISSLVKWCMCTHLSTWCKMRLDQTRSPSSWSFWIMGAYDSRRGSGSASWPVCTLWCALCAVTFLSESASRFPEVWATAAPLGNQTTETAVHQLYFFVLNYLCAGKVAAVLCFLATTYVQCLKMYFLWALIIKYLKSALI